MVSATPLSDSDEEVDAGKAVTTSSTTQTTAWTPAPSPTVFKDVQLCMRRVPPKGMQLKCRPRYGPMTRSYCVVRVMQLDSVDLEVLEFYLGETEGYRLPLEVALRRQQDGTSAWRPPEARLASPVPRWLTEAVLALGGDAAGEFQPAAEDAENSGGLYGPRRINVLDACPGQDLLGDGGIVMHVLEEPPEGGVKPRDLARVSASWQVWFQRNGELLVSMGTFADGASSPGVAFTIDGSGLMVAMELIIKELRPGSHACTRISEEWAIGALAPQGNPSLRGAAIWLELRLHSVENEPAAGEHSSVTSALGFALSKKQQGNDSLAAGAGPDLARAARRYEAGIEALEATLPLDHRSRKKQKNGTRSPGAAEPTVLANDEELPAVEEALLALRLNAAQAELKRCRWKDAEDHCTIVLDSAPDNPKACFRRGLARVELGDLLGASQDLRKALTLSPSNKQAHAELSRVEAMRKERKAEEKSAYGGLFAKMRQKEEAKEQREEAAKKAEEEKEAERKREQKQKQMEEMRAKQAEADKMSKDEVKVEPIAEEDETSPTETAQAPETPSVAADVPQPAPRPEVSAGTGEAVVRGDGELLDIVERQQKERGGANSILPMMPPPDLPYRTVEQPPKVDYQVPAFLRRGKQKA